MQVHPVDFLAIGHQFSYAMNLPNMAWLKVVSHRKAYKFLLNIDFIKHIIKYIFKNFEKVFLYFI